MAFLALLAALVVLTIAATAQHARGHTPVGHTPVAPLAVGTAVDAALPRLALLDERGRPTSLAALRGRYVVLAPTLTLCHELCPITTGVLLALRQKLRASGLGRRVAVVEATVDPWRDTPARVRAFKRRTGSSLTFLTGTNAQIHSLWHAFGVGFQRVPQADPPGVDWWTHKPERFDVSHTSGAFLMDPRGHERVAVLGMPSIGGRLSDRLASLLSATGRKNLRHPQAAWTADQLLEDLRHLMGLSPAQAGARRGRLLGGGRAAIQRHLAALRGRPAVVNVWASWCPPCQSEFPLLARAAQRFGAEVGFLGLDVNDQATSARRFLAGHPLGYPSFSDPGAKAAMSLGHVVGLPTTFFLNSAGHVTHVHAGVYSDDRALAQDIASHTRAAPRP